MKRRRQKRYGSFLKQNCEAETKSMEIIKGKSILNKVAIGPILYHRKTESQVKRRTVENTEVEISRYEAAVKCAEDELKALHKKACEQVGETGAAVFEVHMMMLEDADYRDSVLNIIKNQKTNAEYAAAVTGDNFYRLFADMDDEYFRARAADVKDITDRLLKILSGDAVESGFLTKPVILMAEDLAPSETVQLEKDMLLGFITEQGSPNSHTAILARSMNIPALVSVPVKEYWDGKMAVIDGETGTLYVDPDEKTLADMKKKKLAEEEKERLLQELKDKEDVTLDGTKVKLYANIGDVSDVAEALKSNAAGIGLFRSEFLYLEKKTYPTEEEQFAAYRQVAEMMAGKEVIIRTLDIGADKQADYFKLKKEENPAMGYRAIRICLTRPEIFRTQLRAIYRASAFGKISIMFPMIASLWEVKKAKEIAASVRDELKEQGVPFGDVAIGIMIETPAAAIISEDLAKEVDFFSIGTNDLTQYTLLMSERIKMNTAGEPEMDPVSESADTGEDMQTEKNMAGPYEIIVLDLDGTLTNRDKVITPRTKAALMKAQERGKKVVLASGRPTQGVMPLAKELRLEEYSGYILSFNGGRIINCKTGETVFARSLPVSANKKIIGLAEENQVDIVTYEGSRIIASNPESPYTKLESRINGMEIWKPENMAEYVNFEVPKFLMMEDGDYLAMVEPKVKAAMGKNFSVYRSDPFFLEILPKGIDKAQSLERLLEVLGLTREQMIACGDGYNDLTMIKYAGLGVAMENAVLPVRNAADYITASNNDDGVGLVVEKFMLA